jgi:hypothetical protein
VAGIAGAAGGGGAQGVGLAGVSGDALAQVRTIEAAVGVDHALGEGVQPGVILIVGHQADHRARDVELLGDDGLVALGGIERGVEQGAPV